jgi:hypothetical protein
MASSRLEKLRSRRLDPLIKISGMREAYERLPAEDAAVQYAIGAMQPIDQEYTKRTIEERTRVENQLGAGYEEAQLAIDFDYQGSITNDTHIRAHSDVDVLTIERRWHSIEPPNKATSPYTGNSIDDLREIRQMTAEVLESAFPAATVDQSGSKSVRISGGSLRRKIDLIASAWWYTVEYMEDKEKYSLGIQILDNAKGQRISNKPFLHNKRLMDRDAATNGGLRKLIRLMKSVKYDSDDKIDLNSYDIAGIMYNMPDEWVTASPGYDLALVKNCQEYLRHLLNHKTYRDSIEMPNRMRSVFCPEGASESGLKQMSSAIDILVDEIDHALSRTLRKLTEARILY